MHKEQHLKRLEKQFQTTAASARNFQSTGKWITIDSATGHKTFYYMEGNKPLFLHSPVLPVAEAEKWVEQIQNVKPETHVIFFGLGFGYHIEAFHRRYPQIRFSVFEPDAEVFDLFLTHKSLKDNFPWGNVTELSVSEKPAAFFASIRRLIDKISNALVLVWPGCASIYKEEYIRFNQVLKQTVQHKQQNMAVTQRFEKHWTMNSLANFKYILSTPNFVHSGASYLCGKPAILVAAGPSLDDEIENLRYIKQNGLAYIFSVGSAINTLIEHGVYPHAAFTYDPQAHNINVIRKIIDRNISSIPLVFGSTVGKSTLPHYPGPMHHLIISQDAISQSLLKPKDGGVLGVIHDAPSVAVIALQCLIQMRCSHIILVGQNLAFRDDAYYAQGVPYGKGRTSDDNNAILVEDVYGGQIYSKPSLIKIKKEMEVYLQMLPQASVINTTRGGAHIAGTVFQQLNEVMKELSQSIVDDSWLMVSGGGAAAYDLGHMKENGQELQAAQARFEQLYSALEKVMYGMGESVQKHDEQKLKDAFPLFDDIFDKLLKNPFFQTYIQPRNRVALEVLYSKVGSVKTETRIREKGLKILRFFGDYLIQCKNDYAQIKNEVEAFQIFIKEYRET
jgi:hypothetical protein